MSPVPPGDVVAMFDFREDDFFFLGGGVDVMTPLLLDRRLPFFSPPPLLSRYLFVRCDVAGSGISVSLARSSSPIR